MSDSFEQILDKKFPFFDEEERAIIGDFCMLRGSGTAKFLDAQNRLLELIKGDLLRFYKWESGPETRVQVRQRLLNLSGLFLVVPIGDLRFLAHEARLTQKKTIYESYADPLENDLVEMNSYDLKYFDRLSNFLSCIALSPDMTALDYLSGNRNRNIYPHSQFLVFRKNLQEEVISEDFLTASAEPLTQTVFVTLRNYEGEIRDAATIGFDMVYESAFIDFFQHAPNPNATTLVRNAHLVGKNFLMATVNSYLAMKRDGAQVLNNFPIFLEEKPGNPAEQAHTLMLYLIDHLIPQVGQKIQNWNVELGLPAEHDEIAWVAQEAKETA